MEQQRWYLLHRGELLRPGRMFGGKRLYFIYLHLNKDPGDDIANVYQVKYDFTIDQAVAANEQNLQTLASILSTTSTGGSDFAHMDFVLDPNKLKPTPPSNVWGGIELNTWYGTSDMVLDSARLIPQSDGSLGDPQKLDNSLKVHNEAPNWWDVSAGIPIRKMSQLTFNGASNALEPQQVDKKAIYALIDLYPFGQQRRDLTYSNFTWYPSLVFGVPASQQPLHKPLVGVGWGLRFVQFYAGAIIQKQADPPAGSTPAAGAAKVCSGWCPQFAFGLNLPVKALQDKLKAKPANAGTPGYSKEGVGTDPKGQTK